MNNKFTLWIIDTSSIIYRIYYGISKYKSQLEEKNPTNVIHEFIKIIERIIFDNNLTHIAFALDVKGGTFRSESYENYKSNRKETPADLALQFQPILDYLALRKFKTFSQENFEADDVIGTLAKKAIQQNPNMKVKILTSDKDLFQLINPNVSVLYVNSGFKNLIEYNSLNFEILLGLSPKQFLELKILVGDKSDNYAGITGIGAITGKKLLLEYKSIENIYKNIHKLRHKARTKLEAEKEKLPMIRNLATIRDNLELDFQIKDTFFSYKNIFEEWDPLKDFFNKYSLYAIKSTIKQNYYKQTRILILDIGSNAVKYTVYYCLSPKNFNLICHKNHFIKIIKQIENKQIAPNSMDHIINQISQFIEEPIKKYNLTPNKIRAFGTEWLRQIQNKKLFVDKFCEKTNIKLDILKQDQECKFNWLAYQNDQLQLNDVLILDIGGGSLEIVGVENNKPTKKVSLPIGCNILKKLVNVDNIPTVNDLERIRIILQDNLKPLNFKQNSFLYCSSGSMYSIFSLLIHFQLSEKSSNFTTLKHLEKLYDIVKDFDLKDLILVKNFEQNRADIVKIALIYLIELGKKYKISHFVIGEKNIRDGYLVWVLTQANRQERLNFKNKRKN